MLQEYNELLYDAKNENEREIAYQCSKINGFLYLNNDKNIIMRKILNVSRETLPTWTALW